MRFVLYKFKTLTGEVTVDTGKCRDCREKPCIAACAPKVLKEEDGRPSLAMEPGEVARGKCIECLACELECHYRGKGGLTFSLPLPQVD